MVWIGSSRTASAAPPAPELMQRLAQYAAKLDSMRTHASYRFDGELSTLDRAGDPTSRKVMSARVDADGEKATMTVLSYAEDGEDMTQEAQHKARENEKRRKSKPRYRLPILAEEQARYAFDQVDADATDPARVKITFRPKAPGDDTIEGSAWIDTRTGALVSAGFKLSKTSLFLDYMHFTVEFGEVTPLGAAISSIHVEGQGGILFLRRRFRGSARVYGYTIVP